jgi:uncharacterized membrane protein
LLHDRQHVHQETLTLWRATAASSAAESQPPLRKASFRRRQPGAISPEQKNDEQSLGNLWEGHVTTTTTTTLSGKSDPVVKQITTADVVEAVARGLRDFQAAPRYGLILGATCAAIGLAVVGTLFLAGLPYLAYPIVAGFALICPFLAAGLYEASRRMEAGEPLAWGAIWARVRSRSEIRWMGFMTLFVLIVWMYQVRLLMALFLGYSGMSPTLQEFFKIVLTTSEGVLFLAIGNVIGAVLATVLFSLSVISFPLVLDRDVDFVTAMITSLRAVAANPGPMLFWAAIIVVLLIVSLLPMFLGLLVTLPILGHGTWHLYRRVVAPLPTAG